MMAFDLHAALLLVVAFVLGGLVAFLVRRRAQQRGVSALAQATLLSLDEGHGEPEEPRRPSHPPHAHPPHDPVPAHAIPLAPLEPELPLDLPSLDLPRGSHPRGTPSPGAPAKAKRPARTRPAAEPSPRAADDGAPADAAAGQPTSPTLLAAPEGEPDDLKRLKGIGPQNERRLNAIGIYHWRQIAAWTPEEVRWVGATLAFPGRIEREHWVEQAKALVNEADPEP